ncbi:Adenylate kinase [Vibrio chagasii]|uniref:adenylate kinase n=1 Tax=Vibrio chagasii TaxID=170679 RepID=UPI00164088D8|nr:adenylate kinase [Vibrio chagasii]CAH6973480.1 Adenylate kinase [Vibrio chagasii]CAH7016278.1 Adenylate kinase [Vibrio chagasii]CAH7101743.1 Adenylate kinase [Vibrio chagasii]CAH7306530.1 Adenylate kinase [Vibrio chagasii]
MKKIAVFGKPGSGKSTVSKALAQATGIGLHQLDSLVYKANGEFVDSEVFAHMHERILSSESWIIDGLGPMESFKKRLDTADTLIYIDLPYTVSYWFVTKRLLKGLFVKPEGWPDGSSVIKGTIQSYKMLKLSPTFWNDDLRSRLELRAKEQELHIIRSVSELNSFVHKQVTD